MFRSSLMVVSASILIGLLCALASAQEKQSKSSSTQLGIEIVTAGHPFQFPITMDGGAIETGTPPKRPDWKPTGDTAPLTRIRIRLGSDGDGLRVKIGAVFDDSQPADAPGPKYGAREDAIASYFARLDQTISVDELERFGFEPLVLRVIRYQPEPIPESSANVLPEVVNPLKSLAFVDLQSDEPKSHSYQLTLQNTSARSVVALSFGVAPSHSQTLEGGARPIILPGATSKIAIGASESLPSETSRLTVVFRAVLFDDGTYEGDVVSAAELAAQSKGRQIQSLRCLQLLRGIPDQPSRETIQEVKAAVEKLRIDVDAAVVDELQSQFSLLPKANGKEWLAEKTMDGLKLTRSSVGYQLNDVAEKLARNEEGFDLNQSLARVRERLARFAGN